MEVRSDIELLVLQALRLKSLVDTHAVAEVVGADEAVVASSLEALAEVGLVRRRDGARAGWMLTRDGRADGQRRLADELDASGARDLVSAAYRRFLDLNAEFLSVCTDWQVRDVDAQVLNDHADPDYDTAVVARLGEIHEAVRPVCGDLADALARFARYGPALDEAYRRVSSGDTDWFTKPMIDSYHTVWFELHEDLLSTLGVERATEGH